MTALERPVPKKFAEGLSPALIAYSDYFAADMQSSVDVGDVIPAMNLIDTRSAIISKLQLKPRIKEVLPWLPGKKPGKNLTNRSGLFFKSSRS
jgi:hypothetical protein